MFIIKDTVDATIEWPVTVNTPLDGGKTRKFEFTGVFRRLSDDEKESIGKEIAADVGNDDMSHADAFVDRATRVMVGWKQVVDEAQNPLEFSRDTLRRAVRAPGGLAIMTGINRALQEVESGEKRKN